MNHLFRLFSLASIFLAILFSCKQVTEPGLTVKYYSSNTDFPVVDAGKPVPLLTDSLDAEVVGIAARAVAQDIGLISGTIPKVIYEPLSAGKNIIVAGTIGHSKFIDELIASNRIDVTSIQGKWEAHQLEVIMSPFQGIDKALVIVGSDRRGTAYGLFELSRLLGVSPWVWWADVLPERHKNLYLTAGKMVIPAG